MAVHGEETKNGNNNSQAGNTQQQQQQQQQSFVNTEKQTGQAFSFAAAFGNTSGAISRNSNGEIVSKLCADVKELFANAGNEFANYSVIPLDRNAPANKCLAYSSLIFLFYSKANNSVVYHTLLIEASGEPAPLQDMNEMGQSFKHMTLASDAFDATYVEVTRAAIQRAYPNAEVFGTHASPLLRNWQETTNLQNVVRNCTLAISGKISQAEAKVITLGAIPNGYNMVATKSFNVQSIEDYMGMPLRAEILGKLTIRHANQQRQSMVSLNQQSRDETLGQWTGYIEPVWASDNQIKNPFMPVQNTTHVPPFIPMLVLTSMEFTAVATTIESQVLMILSVLTAMNPVTLAMNFKPRQLVKGEVDMCDVGALNIEADLGKTNEHKAWDTKSSTYTDGEHGVLMQAMFRQGWILALRVAEVSCDTWINAPFVAAADGGQIGAKANYEIIQAVDRLFGNKEFSTAMGNQPFVLVDNERVHCGYFNDRSGNRKDLACIDHLAIANLLGRDNPAAIESWDETFFNTNLSMEKRLSMRKNAIEMVVSPTYTSYGRVIKFNPEALRLLKEISIKLGRDIAVDEINNGGQFNSKRYTAAYATGAGYAPPVPTYANNGGGVTGGGLGRFQTDRWSM